MAVEVIQGEQGDVFICNTSDVAFGPVMENGTGPDFLDWLQEDPRIMEHSELVAQYHSWYDNVFIPALRTIGSDADQMLKEVNTDEC